MNKHLVHNLLRKHATLLIFVCSLIFSGLLISEAESQSTFSWWYTRTVVPDTSSAQKIDWNGNPFPWNYGVGYLSPASASMYCDAEDKVGNRYYMVLNGKIEWYYQECRSSGTGFTWTGGYTPSGQPAYDGVPPSEAGEPETLSFTSAVECEASLATDVADPEVVVSSASNTECYTDYYEAKISVTSAGGGVYVFNANASEGIGIHTYRWNFGDGTTANSALTSHQYERNGSYQVTLTIDGFNPSTVQVFSDSTTQQISVEDAPQGGGSNPPSGGGDVPTDNSGTDGDGDGTFDDDPGNADDFDESNATSTSGGAGSNGPEDDIWYSASSESECEADEFCQATSTESEFFIRNPLGNDVQSVWDVVDAILRLIRLIAIPLIVFFIILSGFKFVTAQGNSTKIKEAKDMLIWTLVGAAVILGAELISNIIQTTVNQVTTPPAD